MKYEIIYYMQDEQWEKIIYECKNPIVPKIGDEVTIQDQQKDVRFSGIVNEVLHEINTWSNTHNIYIPLVKYRMEMK